jgi:hypothetical protein
MRKDILGDWGSHLDDADYACALAALGVLESSGTRRHRVASASALKIEFADGERTAIWRAAKNVNSQTTPATWRRRRTGTGRRWQPFGGSTGRARGASPTITAPRGGAQWRSRADLFDFEALCGCTASGRRSRPLVLADSSADKVVSPGTGRCVSASRPARSMPTS